ncbi:MAG: ATP-dependent helicase [Burkholderiaceae bacterium]
MYSSVPAAASEVSPAPSPAAFRENSPQPLDDLNIEQRSAVEHGTGEQAVDTRPLLVVAGAGSGKTNTLAYRVAYLIQQGADPQRLLLLTFSRRAAAEMERRAGQVLARVLGLQRTRELPSLPWAGTFHSIGARLLREYAPRIGLDESFTVHDRGDSHDLMALVRHEIGLSGGKTRFPMAGTCLAIYSRTLNGGQPLAAVLAQVFPWCAQWEAELKRLFGAYVEAKQEQNVLDFDDLLLFWERMLAEPQLAAELGARFDHVLVDEYQDTNRLQASVLQGLKPDGRGLTVVGDDAQAIYSFRGATVQNILQFPQAFTQPARLVTLERNYRSTQTILDASNAVIALSPQRHPKALWTDRAATRKPQLVLVPDEAEQARWVADRMLEQREAGLALKSQAVLFRTSTHSAALELELARRNIPFVKFGGLKFLEAAHVKDVLAVLRFAQNPRGRMAGFRVLQLIPGIGPVTATRLLDTLGEAAQPGDAVKSFVPPAAASEPWRAFAAVYAALRAPGLRWPADLDLVREWYLPHLERLHDDAHARRIDVQQLLQLAAGYASRERFLTELTLDPPQATSDESNETHRDEDYCILSTIHSAKGQEWNSVYVLNVVDGCMPSDLGVGSAADLEEERRLLYVAMTRAREHLHLIVPQRFYVTQQTPYSDRHLYAGRTRFITDAMLGLFEQCVWPPAAQADLRAAAQARPVMQVREQARALWR